MRPLATKGIATIFLATAALGSVAGQVPSASSNAHVFFHIQVGPAVPAPVSGRLLVFVRQGSGDKEVNVDEFHPSATWVTAIEVQDLAASASVEVDGSNLAFPSSFSAMPTGDYEAQAVLDVDHSYNYSGRSPKDWSSNVVALPHWTPGAGSTPTLVLDRHPVEDPGFAAAMAKAMPQAKPGVAEKVELSSSLLTAFWGRDTRLKAWVILPPGYTEHTGERYPTVYCTHGFGGRLDTSLLAGLRLRDRMVAGTMPPMIWVMLDESVPQGTHEFADSANNGRWGAALTTELIPYLESRYRMDARPTGRLLNGHSSGGWATLQLQINYPRIFGGTWSTSPDPSDFHNFTGPDLYATNANMYMHADGSVYPIMRDNGKVVATLQQFAQLESVLGPYGGQLSSFDWVFSPKGDSGAPQPMFDRKTGAVDPSVVAYWHDHYDLAYLVESRWSQLKLDLRGRIHLLVGTADTFYLDGAAHLFEARLDRLGAEPHFTYLPGKTHFDLYVIGKDRGALFDQIGTEMYAVARPGAVWKKKPLG